MRQYELMMILDSGLSDTDRDTLISEIETEIKATGATITSADHPGERQLAYRIHGSQTGYYLLYARQRRWRLDSYHEHVQYQNKYLEIYVLSYR